MESVSSIEPNRLGFLIEEIDQNSSIFPCDSSSDVNSATRFLITMSDYELEEQGISDPLHSEDVVVADAVDEDNENEAESPRSKLIRSCSMLF